MKKGSTFLKGLALGSLQCGGVVQSAPLPRLSPNLAPPLPPTRVNEKGEQEQACVSLSAGKELIKFGTKASEEQCMYFMLQCF